MILATVFIFPDLTALVEICLFIPFTLLLYRVYYLPIQAVLERRRRVLQEGTSAAQRAKEEVEEARRAYEAALVAAHKESAEALAQARAEAARLAAEIAEQASKRASEQTAQALTNLEAEVEKLRVELRQQMPRLVRQAVERVLGDSLPPERREQLALAGVARLERISG